MVSNSKPRSYWGVFLAAGLAATPCFSQALIFQHQKQLEIVGEDPREQKVTQHHAEGQTAKQGTVEPESSKVTTHPAQVSAANHDHDGPTDSGGEAGQDSYIFLGDGLAQWAMTIISFVALLLSAWAVWLLKLTLTETRQAVREAQSGTSAAHRAVDVTLDIGKKQTQAYVSIDRALVRFDDGKPLVAIDFRNSGNSPALHLMYGVRGEMKRVDNPTQITLDASPERNQTVEASSPVIPLPASSKYLTGFYSCQTKNIGQTGEIVTFNIRIGFSYKTVFDESVDIVYAGVVPLRQPGGVAVNNSTEMEIFLADTGMFSGKITLDEGRGSGDHQGPEG